MCWQQSCYLRPPTGWRCRRDVRLTSRRSSSAGYHKCSREEAARLAALIYRVRHGENKQELQSVPQLLRELVPADLTKAHSSSEWKRNIVAAYNQYAGMSRDDLF